MSNRLEEIKDEIAKNNNYSCWAELWAVLSMSNKSQKLQVLSDNASIQYARECCEASLEKASENAQAYKDFDYVGVDSESITQESNIILL